MSFTEYTKKTNQDPAVGVIISKLLSSVSYTHRQHLTTNIYSRHKALQSYYEDIPALIDAFSEVAISRGFNIAEIQLIKSQSVEIMIDEFLLDCDRVHNSLSAMKLYDMTNALEDIMTFLSGIKYKLALVG